MGHLRYVIVTTPQYLPGEKAQISTGAAARPYNTARMPLFKRLGQNEEPDGPPPGGSPRVLNLQAIFDRLEEEIFRAERYARPLVCLCIVPQSLPGAPTQAELGSAAEFVSKELRFSDRVGVLTDGTIVAVLPETQPAVARVVGDRIAGDLVMRSTGTTHRNWHAGTSAFPDDGADPPSLVQAAIDRAQR